MRQTVVNCEANSVYTALCRQGRGLSFAGLVAYLSWEQKISNPSPLLGNTTLPGRSPGRSSILILQVMHQNAENKSNFHASQTTLKRASYCTNSPIFNTTRTTVDGDVVKLDGDCVPAMSCCKRKISSAISREASSHILSMR